MNRFESDPHSNPDTSPENEDFINEIELENMEGQKSITDLEMQAEEKEKEEEKKREEEERFYQEERERRIEATKRELLQEKINELFKEFGELLPEDLESLLNQGTTSGGGKMESSSLGELDPEKARTLAEMYKQGKSLLNEIIEKLPELLEALDTELTEEAEERVDEQLDSEKEAKNNPDILAEKDMEENLGIITENPKPNPEGASELGAGPENPTA